MSTATLSKRQLAILQNSVNQNRWCKIKAWEIPAITALECMHKHVTGEGYSGKRTIPECLDELHSITGESAQSLLNTAVAIIELEQFNFTIH